MAKQTNTVAIGAFISGAILVLFSLLFYVGERGFGRESANGLLVFDGSVKGRTIGAPVALKGVQIGEVTDIYVVINKDSFDVVTPVEITVYSDRMRNVGKFANLPSLKPLVERGLRAQLQTQSLLTGLLYVQLDFHPESEVRYLGEELGDLYADRTDVIELPTIPTELERFTRTLNEFDFVAAGQQLADTLAGLESFVNNPKMQSLPDQVASSLASIEKLSNTLRTELKALSPGLGSLVTNADTTLQSLNQEIPALSEAAKQSLQQFDGALSAARSALESVDYNLSDESAVLHDVRRAAQELGKAGRALQSLAETLETQPEAILRGKTGGD